MSKGSRIRANKEAKGFGKQVKAEGVLTLKQQQQRNEANISVSIALTPHVELMYREGGRYIHSSMILSDALYGFSRDSYWSKIKASLGCIPDGYYFVDHELRTGNYLGDIWLDAVDELVDRGLAEITNVSELSA